MSDFVAKSVNPTTPGYTFYGYRISNLSDYIAYPPAAIEVLPAELRLMILEYLLSSDEPIDPTPCTEDDTSEVHNGAVRIRGCSVHEGRNLKRKRDTRPASKLGLYTSILRVCHYMYEEGSQMLYSRNSFQLLDKPWSKSCPLWVNEIGPGALKHLTYLALTVRLTGYSGMTFSGSETEYRHPVAPMTKSWVNMFAILSSEAKNLRSLHLDFVTPDAPEEDAAVLHHIAILHAIVNLKVEKTIRTTGALPKLYLGYLEHKMDVAFDSIDIDNRDKCDILTAISWLQTEVRKLKSCVNKPIIRNYQHGLSFDVSEWKESNVQTKGRAYRAPQFPSSNERDISSYSSIIHGVQLLEKQRALGGSDSCTQLKQKQALEIHSIKLDLVIDFWGELEELGLVEKIAECEDVEEREDEE